jgi:hypothetical protein
MKYCIIVFLFCLAFSFLHANIFMDISANLSPVTEGTVSWADFDNDGDLDLLVSGYNPDLSPNLQTRLFRNDNGTFNNTGTVFPGLYQSATAWCDVDNDNDLDLVITGNTVYGSPQPLASYYENRNGTLTLVSTDILPVSKGSISWIDIDKDGFKDLIITGNASTSSIPAPLTIIYHNDHGVLSMTEFGMPGVFESAATVIDYNSDGWDDILFSGNSGNDSTPTSSTHLFKNNNGFLEEVTTSLPAVRLPSLDWADYDRDGDPDLIVAGYSDELGQSITSIYSNLLGNFTSIASDFFTCSPSSITWGDYDNEGDMDLLLTGNTILGGILEPITALYRNDDSLFLFIYDAPVTVINGMAAFGDYDADNDLDIALTGEHPLCPGGPITRIYRNDITIINHAPATPTGLTASFNNSVALFQWESSTDTETSQASLTYNLRIGTTPGGCEILSAMSDLISGRSLLPQKGNTRYSHTRKIPGLSDGIYYWSVQAIDDAYTSSPFAEEQTFIVNSTSTNDDTVPNISISVYPNPFTEYVTFKMDDSRLEIHRIWIYNLKGQIVKELKSQAGSGTYQMIWNGTDNLGNRCANGVYLYHASSEIRPHSGMLVYIR